MEITGEYDIPAAPATVWAALNDPEVLVATLPGCESLELREENAFDARMTVRIGPMTSRFRMDVHLDELDPPRGYRISGTGKAGPSGFARGSARVRLAGIDGGTRLSYVAEVEVGGKLAQLGSRLVQGAARQTAEQFFSGFAAHVEEAGEAAAPVSSRQPSRLKSPTRWLLLLLAAIAVAALLIRWYSSGSG